MFTEQLGNHMRLGDAARLAIAVELLAQVRRKANGERHVVGATKIAYYDNTPNPRAGDDVMAAPDNTSETIGASGSWPYYRGRNR